MTTQKFKIVFFSIIGLAIMTMIITFKTFDLVETDTAINWTMKYFALPVILILIPTCYFIYIKYIKQYETKELKSKFAIDLMTFFRVTILTLAMTIIFIPAILSLIILSNAYLGDSKKIELNATVVDSYQSENKGQIYYHIKVEDKHLNKMVKFSVDKQYKIGQVFNKTLLIGYWNLLYSKKKNSSQQKYCYKRGRHSAASAVVILINFSSG